MGPVFIGLLLFFPLVLMYEQNQYTMKMERIEMVGFNNSFFESVKLFSYKHNRTQACVNLTALFKVAFGNELTIEVQAYKFASNEYREFPLRFMFNFCSAPNKNDFGLGNIFKCGNMTGCPLRKTTYHFCHWFPDAKRCPPYIPAGSYMADLKLFYRSTEALFLQGYCIVDYPITYKHSV